MVIREEGYGLRITVYQLKKSFNGGNLPLTLLLKLVVPGWQANWNCAHLGCRELLQTPTLSSCFQCSQDGRSSGAIWASPCPFQVEERVGWHIKELMERRVLVCFGEELEEGWNFRRGTVFGVCCTLKGWTYIKAVVSCLVSLCDEVGSPCCLEGEKRRRVRTSE